MASSADIDLVIPGRKGTNGELLDQVRQEMRRAVGFDNDEELRNDRILALNFIKGDMSTATNGADGIPSLPNRSKANSSDINDAIETILPDLMEIFTGGDDVVSFIPTGPDDVEAAKQETAYLNHVVFQENDGFLNFYTAIKDSLTLKTGIFTYAWQQEINEREEDFKGKNAVEMLMASKDGELVNVTPDPMPEGDNPNTSEPTYSFTVKFTKDLSKAKYWAVAPDDFGWSPDTINIQNTTYCVMRARPRVQDLIADGYDENIVRSLPSYIESETDQIQQARDTAGEYEVAQITDQTSDDLRQVEIRKHFIRKLGSDNKLEIWQVVTDARATVEIHSEKVQRIQFAVGSPYLTAHRLCGRSLSDMLFEIQKIKTALTRAVLDSAYFALNQRHVIDMTQANDYTIADYQRNIPGSPVRVKGPGAVTPLNGAGLSFDAYQALEYFSTQAEGRTGVVRNAQGLNPDTLHDTAKGAMALLSAAQKRTRMIARVLAEVMIKPLYLGIHATIRENQTAEKISQLLGKWVPVNPTTWAERNAMTVEVGLGASGKDMEIAAMQQIQGMQKMIVEGGGAGTLVTPENIYKSATDMAKKLGSKTPEEYFTDPSTPEAKAAIEAKQNQPNPDMVKIQGEQQLQQSKQQGEMQLEQAKLASTQQIETAKAQAQSAVQVQANQLEHERMQAKQANDMALEQAKIESAERIAVITARIRAEAQIEAARIAAKADDGAAELERQESLETSA